MTDRWLAVLLERLRDLSLERETIVLLVSAHGYLFGELQLHSVSSLGLSWLRTRRASVRPLTVLARGASGGRSHDPLASVGLMRPPPGRPAAPARPPERPQRKRTRLRPARAFEPAGRLAVWVRCGPAGARCSAITLGASRAGGAAPARMPTGARLGTRQRLALRASGPNPSRARAPEAVYGLLGRERAAPREPPPRLSSPSSRPARSALGGVIHGG